MEVKNSERKRPQAILGKILRMDIKEMGCQDVD
jgi:hypothetical protein